MKKMVMFLKKKAKTLLLIAAISIFVELVPDGKCTMGELAMTFLEFLALDIVIDVLFWYKERPW